MPVTSLRGDLREGESVYRQLTFWIAGGPPHSMRVVKLSPLRWQDMYKEAHLLRGVAITNGYHGATIHVPIAGAVFEIVAVQGFPDNAFVVSSNYYDPSTGS